jgi:heterodisulfide reductase subunit C
LQVEYLQKADPDFKRNLSTVEGAGQLSYCYQCSACVAECPSAQHCPGFNPREIVLASLLGVAGYLTEKDSVIWQCTTCYKCYERCPQGTHPVEVVTALKNIAFEAGNAPDDVVSLRETVKEQGTIIVPSHAIEKRRAELGLEKAPSVPPGELKKLLG